MLFLFAGAAAPTPAIDAATPTRVVERFHETLVSVLQEAETLAYEGRFRRLEPAIERAFDLEFMARFAIGTAWNDLDEGQRRTWVEQFRAFTIANYASRLRRYGGERFEVLGEEPAARGTVFVRTRVVRPGDEDVSLVYRLRETEQGWRIVDVYAKGTVSELALRRSEYSSVLRKDGFTRLLEVIQGKISELAAGKTDA
ncbi:MAG: toluene tolerance protein [Candidatus Binatia bacterium]|nr:MAG: toluene tolerance protein [Candidatus Binatia bacterium]